MRCQRRFMEQAQQYGLLGEAEAVLLAGTGQDGQELGRQLDPAAKRAHKIARFRMEKDAHAKLEAVRLQVGWCMPPLHDKYQ